MTGRPAKCGLLKDDSAVATVEFAIVGTLLFLVSFAVVDLGMILWTQGALQAVASEAARCGAISGSACTGTNTVQSYVTSTAANWVMSTVIPNLTVNVNSAVNTATCPTITVGSYETVQISTTYLATWLPPPFSNYTINVCASYTTGP